MGKDYLFGLSTVILLVISFYIKHIRKVVLTYKDAAGMWYADRLKPILEGVSNLVMNLIFVQYFGDKLFCNRPFYGTKISAVKRGIRLLGTFPNRQSLDETAVLHAGKGRFPPCARFD